MILAWRLDCLTIKLLRFRLTQPFYYLLSERACRVLSRVEIILLMRTIDNLMTVASLILLEITSTFCLVIYIEISWVLMLSALGSCLKLRFLPNRLGRFEWVVVLLMFTWIMRNFDLDLTLCLIILRIHLFRIMTVK